MYFNIEEQNMINQEDEKISNIETTNPRFSGKHHTQESRRSISQTQKKRYATIKDYLKQGLQRLTEEDVRRICKQVVDEYVTKNTTQVKKNNNLILPL